MSITATAILPKPIDGAAMLEEMKRQLELYKPFIKRDFEQTTRTWKGEKPVFVVVKSVKGSELRLSLRVTGPEKGRKRWWWLEKGTPVRYAVMSKDFEAKTVPGKVVSYLGKGAAVHVSKLHPRPGIKARMWRKAIRDEHVKPFQSWMATAMLRAAAASGHQMKGR